MAGYYTVQQGDCLASIAAANGLDAETIWQRSENAQLKAKRPNPNILFAGDRLFIPDKELRTEDRPSDAKHSFVLNKKATFLEIAVWFDEKPVAGKAYTLVVDGRTINGATDGKGILKQEIAPQAKKAQLHFDEPLLDWDLMLGCLDPVDEITGVQQRLANLGYPVGTADGIVGPHTRGALRQFKSRNKLPPNGEPDSAVRRVLRSTHDGS